MALLSDVDWLILLAAAAFLLFGREAGPTLRTLGRWYGRAGRLKQELLADFHRAADLPPPAPGVPLSLRGSLLGLEAGPGPVSAVPAAVRRPLPPAPQPADPPPGPWTGGAPVSMWASTVPPEWSDFARSR